MAKRRIAILVIAHANPAVFMRLVAALRHPEIAVYTHIDARSDLSSFQAPGQDHVTFMPHRIANNWGAFTQVEVAMTMMRAARTAGPFASYALISGDTLPLVENAPLVEALSATPTVIRLKRQLPGDKSYQRVRGIYLPSTALGRIRGAESHLDRVLTETDFVEMQRAIGVAALKRDIAFPILKGSQWFSMSDAHLGAVLDYVERNRDFCDVFRYAMIPDELFFHSVFGTIVPDYTSPAALMESDWTRKPKPFTFTKASELDHIFASQGLFYRKFSDAGLALVDAVLARRLDLAAIGHSPGSTPWRLLRGAARARLGAVLREDTEGLPSADAPCQ